MLAVDHGNLELMGSNASMILSRDSQYLSFCKHNIGRPDLIIQERKGQGKYFVPCVIRQVYLI